MNRKIFVNVLKTYGIDTDQVYEDLSELGKGLWHNDRLALKVVWVWDKQPCLVIVILRPTGEYLYFQCSLEEFDILTVEQVVEFVKANSGSLYDTAMKANDVLDISIGHRNWTFKVFNG